MKRLTWAAPFMVLYLAGCTSWAPTTISPRQLIQEQQPDRIRVMRTDGTRLDLREPWLEADSLMGIVRGRRVVPWSEGSMRRRNVAVRDTVRVALTDITAVDTRRPSFFRTVGLVAAIGGVGFGAFAALVVATWDGN